MAKDQLIDEWSSRAMIAILRGQRHNGLLPEPLPSGTEIAHKTGTLHDTLNDVGIVYLNGDDPYVIAVMTTDLPTLDAGRRFIRGVSRMAYDALGRFASS
jgi:beta-lactamase class A